MFYSRIKRGRKLRNRRRKERIRYDQALEALEIYHNDELKISTVIDNGFFPEKSISHTCQVPSCSQRIRYEYVMENKKNGDILVVGSTCVWELLDMNSEQIKDFNRIERSIKDYHKMLEWSKENPDVVEKLERLKMKDIGFFRPFWEEIEYAPLDAEDTDYIRELDVDKVIYVESNIAIKAKTRVFKNRERAQRILPSNYNTLLGYLKELTSSYPNNKFYNDLSSWVSSGKTLSSGQLSCIDNDYKKKIASQAV